MASCNLRNSAPCLCRFRKIRLFSRNLTDFLNYNKPHKKDAARIINLKAKFTFVKPLLALLEQINAVAVYEMNIFQTLCFVCFCKNGNTPSIFKHINMRRPSNKYTTRSKYVLFKPLYKKNFAKFTLNYGRPHKWNIFILPSKNV